MKQNTSIPLKWIIAMLILFCQGLNIGALSAQTLYLELQKNGTPLMQNKMNILPKEAVFFSVDTNAVQQLIRFFEKKKSSDTARAFLTVPLPDGKMIALKVEPSSILEPALAAKYPEIKNFRCYGVKDKTVFGSLITNRFGVDVFLSGNNFELFISPNGSSDKTSHRVFWGRDNRGFSDVYCENETSVSTVSESLNRGPNAGLSAGTILKTYRIAIVNTAAQTDFNCYRTVTPYHCDDVANFITAMAVHLAKVNVNYERDMSIHFILVNNNEQLYLADEHDSYLGAGTYPFAASLGGSSVYNIHQFITAVIGTNNFDVGHCIEGACNGAGVSFISGVCNSDNKGKGKSAYPSVNTFCHELGHQFSAPHSWNAVSCGSQWSSISAVEPGAGITWMSYKNRCAIADQVPYQESDNNTLQYAHVKSYEFIQNYTNSVFGGCGIFTSTNNISPTVTVPDNGLYIPMSTPFQLSGSAVDSDDNALTYAWQEVDTGPRGPMNTPVGNAPIFTALNPVNTAVRIFPRLTDIINNTKTPGEILPAYSRNLTFRLFVRDNAGGTAYNETSLKVNGNSGPFVVCSQSQNFTYKAGSTIQISWTVANTNAFPVHCTNVKISLSADGGYTFPYVLVDATPNDGNQLVMLPAITTVRGRIKVEAVDNIFFNISRSDLIIDDPAINIEPHCDSSVCFLDADGDGFGTDKYTLFCGSIPPVGYVLNSLDCNDALPLVNPGITETCNGIDDNCNGLVDEIDMDGDGFYACINDCADNNTAINPSAQEIVDGIDNNCNGTIDENAALSFDGTDCVNLTHVQRPEEMTLSCWIKTGYSGSWKKIINWHGTNNYHNIELSVSGGALVYAEDDGIWHGNYVSENIADGNWHYFTLTRMAGAVYTAYIDGEITAVNSYTCSPVTNVLSIGGVDNYGEFIGTLDELRMWNFAKTQEQIRADMVCATCDTAARLLLYYDFNEGVPYQNNNSVYQLYDRSGNNGKGNFVSFDLYGNSSNFTEGKPMPYWYRDIDDDGFGNPLVYVRACPPPDGYVSDHTDCNDDNFFAHPNTNEICDNGIDDDCNGIIDERCLIITGQVKNTICPATANGSIVISVRGGATPYDYYWSNGATTKNIQHLSAGMYTVFVTDHTSFGMSRSFTVETTYPSEKPPVPDLISGPSRICIGDTLYYSIPDVVNASSYNWTAPFKSEIIAGQGTAAVTVVFFANYRSGNLSVTASNCVGTSAKRLLAVKSISPPSRPGSIAGHVNVCYDIFTGSAVLYTINKISNASGYIWQTSDTLHAHIMAHNSIGENDTAVTIHFDTGYTAGLVTVASLNNCGISAVKALSVNKMRPETPVLSGNLTPCAGSVEVYTASSLTANSYQWVIPASVATIVSGQGTSSVAVIFKPSFIRTVIRVNAVSVCGISLSGSLIVNKCVHDPVVAFDHR